MKLLLLHSSFIEYKANKKALDSAEKPLKDKERIEDCLVVFNASEKGDSQNLESVIKKMDKEIRDVAEQVQVNKIVIYPWVHLTSKPGNPEDAQKVQEKIAEKLSDSYEVHKSPFGWYKEFQIHVKGHPLAELSREIEPGKSEDKTREEVTEKIESKYCILRPDGTEIEIDVEDSSCLSKIEDATLKKFIKSEEIKGQPKKEPPSIKEMRRLELVDYEPASDSGNFRFYPKGNLVFELIKEWADEIAMDRLNSMQIDTPILYDWSQEDIREQGSSFHERHYTVKVPDDDLKEYVLRFAGDFGLFRIMKDANLSYKNLPLNIYEFSKSFRYEKKGELSGLRRLRAFHMPDIHSFTENIEDGWKTYQDIYEKYNDLAEATNTEFAVAFRVVEEFYEKNKDKIVEMLKYSEKPALIEVLSEMKHYWAVKHEFQGIDSVGGNLQLSTVQLDVEDAERYGITYTSKENKEEGCIICHSSIGSIERWLYAILEEALKKDKPSFPLWLSPTQVRLCSVSDEYNDYCEELADIFTENNIRADIDDRTESVSKKIRDAEMEWVPYTLVIGEREVENQELTVRTRDKDSEKKLELEELIKEIKAKTSGYPYKPLPLPEKISKRPSFVG